MNVIKDPHTCIFTGPTSCSKTQLVLDLLEHEYKQHFENIVILCPTLRWNMTYRERSWVWEDNFVFLVNPKGNLFNYIETLCNFFAGKETLFIVDDIIADENLDKKRQSLLDLAISGRHKKHSLWLLTQSYTALPKNLRRRKKQIFVWYPCERSDMKLIDEETNLMSPLDLHKIQKSKT